MVDDGSAPTVVAGQWDGSWQLAAGSWPVLNDAASAAVLSSQVMGAHVLAVVCCRVLDGAESKRWSSSEAMYLRLAVLAAALGGSFSDACWGCTSGH